MAGAMRKVAVYLGLVEDQDRYDDVRRRAVQESPTSYAEPAPEPERGSAPEPESRTRERSATVATLADRRPVQRGVALTRRRFANRHAAPAHVQRGPHDLGEHFRDGTPVIMNLSEMDDVDAKRLVDFSAGLIFGLRGDIERVTAKVFLLSPPDVTVTAEDKARIASGGFFNQS